MEIKNRILITGGRGFVGRVLIQKLLDETQHDLILIENKRKFPQAIREHPRVYILNLDILTFKKGDIPPTMRECDRCIHLAGMVSRDFNDKAAIYAIHILGSQKLLHWIQKSQIQKIILLSTSGVSAIQKRESQASPNIPPPATQDDDPYAVHLALRYPYYTSKIIQEKIFRDFSYQSHRQVIALRPSLILGAGDEELSSTGDVMRIMAGKRPFVPRGGLSVIDVKDVAAAIIATLEKKNFATTNDSQKQEEYFRSYLLGGENLTFAKFLAIIEEESKKKHRKISMPNSRWIRKTMMWLIDHSEKIQQEYELQAIEIEMSDHYWYLDCSRAKKELNIRFQSARTAIANTIHNNCAN